MKTAIFTYTKKGCILAKKLCSALPNAAYRLYAAPRVCTEDFLAIPQHSALFYGEQFAWADALIFVGACGIAVRNIAPYVRDKCTDPAVIVVDDAGKYVIPILSGHIGGANEMAAIIAKTIGAQSVITTATDGAGRFSVDAWAAKHGWHIENMETAKKVSAAILERDIPVICDFPVISDYPSGIDPDAWGDIGILISWEIKRPFPQTLRIVPSTLHLGIGCKKGTDAETIHSAVETVLRANGIDKHALLCAATIDLKKEETGLLEYCRTSKLPVRFYTAEELNSVQGFFASSPFVQKITGTDNVCARAAMCGADRLIVEKTAANGVTVAIAAEKTEVRFE